MIDVSATIDVKPITERLKSIFNNMKNVVNPEKKWIMTIAPIVYADVMRHFAAEEGPNGKWKSWSTAYTAHMNRMGRGSNKLLQFNGRLRDNFKATKYISKGDSVVWYNDAKTKSGFPYAKAHDEGGTVTGRPPKRSFMWLSSKSLETISKATLDFILEHK